MKPFPKVTCPTCKKAGDWFAGAFGPFCSQRCKLIDLGKWFNQEYCISEPLAPGQLEKHGGPPPRPGSDGGEENAQN